MKTLFVTDGPPLPTDRGARVRDLALISRVAAERPTSMLSLLRAGDSPEPLAALGDSLEALATVQVTVRPRRPIRPRRDATRMPLACAPFLSGEAVAAFTRFVRRLRPELIELEHWTLLPLVGALDPAERPAMVASLHNVGSAQYRAMARASGPARALGYRLKSGLVRRAENMLDRFDGIVCVSESDRELARALAPGAQADTVPNGVDCDALQPLPERGPPPAILLVANLHYRPNLEAAAWLCQRVMPALHRSHPGARARLVGPGGGRFAAALGRLPGIEHHGAAGDLVPHYRSATVAVAPLFAGGGTRLKVLEAMALGRAVVSTSVGCAGLGLVEGEHLLIADDEASFAAAIARLLDHPAERHALAASARDRVEAKHDWGRSAQALLDAHDRALGRRTAQRLGRKRLAASA